MNFKKLLIIYVVFNLIFMNKNKNKILGIAEYLPFIKRIDGLTIEFKAKNIIEAYNIIQLLAIAGTGINASYEQLG